MSHECFSVNSCPSQTVLNLVVPEQAFLNGFLDIDFDEGTVTALSAVLEKYARREATGHTSASSDNEEE